MWVCLTPGAEASGETSAQTGGSLPPRFADPMLPASVAAASGSTSAAKPATGPMPPGTSTVTPPRPPMPRNPPPGGTPQPGAVPPGVPMGAAPGGSAKPLSPAPGPMPPPAAQSAKEKPSGPATAPISQPNGDQPSPLLKSSSTSGEGAPASVPPGQGPAGSPAAPPPVPLAPVPAVQEAQPSLFYLKDKEGNLQPVLGFTFEDFEEMVRQKLRQEQPETPPAYAIEQLVLSGTARGSRAEFKAAFGIRLFSDQWVRVPLRLDQAVLRSLPQFAPEGEHFLQFSPAEGYVAWIRSAKDRQMRITFEALVPLATAGDETRLRLFLPRAARSELTLDAPGPKAVSRISEGATLVPGPQPDANSPLHVLGAGGDFELAWRSAAGPGVSMPPVLESVGAVLAKVDGQGISFEARLTVRSFGAPFDYFRVRLPKGAQYVPAASGNSTITPVALGGPSGEDWKVVEVRLPGKTVGPEEVVIAARTEYDAPGAGIWSELGGFEVIGAERQWGYLAISAASDWHVLLGPGRGVRQVEDLPATLRPADLIAGFEYFMQPFSLAARAVPRTTRITVDPEYVFLVEPRQVTLQAKLKYSVRTRKVRTLDVELGNWELEDVGPDNVVATDAVADAPSGLLSIPLKQDSMGQIEIVLRARRRLPADTKRLVLELPRLRGPAEGVLMAAPATVAVVPDDNVELVPEEGTLVGLVRQQGRQLAGLPPRSQEPLVYRGEPGKAVFAAAFRVLSRQVRVSVSTNIRLDDQRADVEQKLAYAVAYEPLDRLALEVPRTLAVAEGVEILGDEGKRLAWTEVPLGQPPSSSPPTVRKLVSLPAPRIGSFELVLRYTVPVERLQPKATVACTIPLVMPAEGELAANRAILRTRQGIQAQLRGKPWAVVEKETSDPRPEGLEVACPVRATELPLGVYLEDPSALGLTVVDRAWIQTWLAGATRQDRAVFRFTSTKKQVELVVPAGVHPREVELWLDDKRIKGQSTPEARIIVALPNDTPAARHRLEAVYRLAHSGQGPGAVAIELPRLGPDTWVQRTYWQLVLPAQEHVLLPPAGFTEEYRWGWTGFFWGREPLLNQPALEAWCGARHLTEVPTRTSQYLYSVLGSVSRCEVRTVRRPLVVLGASGAALVLGLLWVYVRAARHPLCLAAGAAALSWAIVVYPDLSLLGAQAAALGVVLAAGAAALQRRLERRQRAAVWEGSSSVLERTPARSTPRPAAPVMLESTEVAPAPASDSMA